MTFEERISKIDKIVQPWLKENNLNEAKPRELMPHLIKNGIYTHDIKEGKPLRDDLRKLKEKDSLHLIRGLVAEEKKINTYWCFKRI